MNQPPLILLCDDESHILHVLGLKLRGAGYDVVTASDGEEGLRQAAARKPDLLITDYQMPRMNGIELCRALRQNGQTQNIPVVLLTGQGHRLSDNAVASLNIAGNLSKPFSPRELLSLTQEILAHSEGAVA